MDANDGDVYMRAYQTAGTGLGGGNLVVVNTANTLEDLLSNNNHGTMSLLKRPSTSEPPSQMVFIKPWRLLSSLKPFKV